jgi:hypothetical protein
MKIVTHCESRVISSVLRVGPELRAAVSAARLWRDRGNRKKACDILAPVYSWFAEGFATRKRSSSRRLDELDRGIEREILVAFNSEELRRRASRASAIIKP